MNIALDDGLKVEIARLHNLDLDGLRLRWRTAFGRAAPATLSKILLLRLLAYRLQAQTLGDLSRETRRLLDNLAGDDPPKAGERAVSVPIPGQGKLITGTVLIREHEGRRHHVVVTEAGFLWDGRSFPSLTKVAFAITGTKWNGPRFFGLRDARP